MPSSDQSVADLVKHIAESLVENPDGVDVRIEQERRETVVELMVDPDDMGRVSGSSTSRLRSADSSRATSSG